MKLLVKRLKLQAGKPIAFIHRDDAKRLGLHPGEKVHLCHGPKVEVVLTNIVEDYIKKGQVALSDEILSYLGLMPTDRVHIETIPKSKGSLLLDGNHMCLPYTKESLKQIIKDIVNNNLSEAEIAYFISGVTYCGMSLDEIKNLIDAIVSTGKVIDWGAKKIADKHCIGGIPGNRTTPIVVPICAAAGIVMPKTSSRAITSAAGTADVVETVAHVDFPISELKRIVHKTGACLAWGGALGLAPADDKLIQVEKILDLDPEPQLLASILAKKIAVGSTHILIDIPYGDGAKVSKAEGLKLKKKFLALGIKLELKIQVVLTKGSEPIGNGIGPVLEMKDVLHVLRQENSPKDLEDKSIFLAGIILEMMGKAKKGQGEQKAFSLLQSGKALKKFEEIIKAQRGNIDDLPEAPFTHTIHADHSGKIKSIDNHKCNALAHILGCPLDKAAGIYLDFHVNNKVKSGDPVMTLHAESKVQLSRGLDYIRENMPIRIE